MDIVAKGVPIAWPESCFLCKQPKTIVHVVLDCWDAGFFWDILQITLKELPLCPRGIRYLSFEEDGTLPYGLLMPLCLHITWRSRLAVRHADVDARLEYKYFVKHVWYTKEVFKVQLLQPE